MTFVGTYKCFNESWEIWCHCTKSEDFVNKFFAIVNKSVDTFTKEILNGNLDLLCSVLCYRHQYKMDSPNIPRVFINNLETRNLMTKIIDYKQKQKQKKKYSRILRV